MVKDNNENKKNMISKNSSSYPLIAGILLLIAGLLGILTAVSTAMLPDSYYLSVFADYNFSISEIKTFINICISIFIVLSVLSILGGLLCFKRKMWGFALGFSILGLFTIGPLFISSVLALIAVILLFLSKEEFQK